LFRLKSFFSSIVSETPYFLYKGDYISGSGEKYLVGLVNYQKETGYDI
jgi:hypothetical protein